MAKFKVGDKVRVIYTDPEDWYDVGDVGVVKYVNIHNLYKIEFTPGYRFAAEEQLELVTDNTQNWWETPEGIEWLSSQQNVEDQFLKFQEKEEEKTYHVGQRFWVTPSNGGAGWYCILARVKAGVVCFINLESGDRINESIHVLDSRKITEDEMKMIAEYCTFQLL